MPPLAVYCILHYDMSYGLFYVDPLIKTKALCFHIIKNSVSLHYNISLVVATIFMLVFN